MQHIMVKLFYIIALLFFFQSCNRAPEKASKYSQKNKKSSIIKKSENVKHKHIQDKKSNRDTINKFLNKPFDLFKFKEKKRMSNSGIGRKESYYFKPNKEGMYYRYFLFSRLQGYIGTNKNKIIRKNNGLEITVYKELGKYRFKYSDPTEILIEVRARFNDFDLPELALVGLDSSFIIKEFGKPDYYKKECMIYQFKNRALILNINNKKVKWLKYLNLEEGIDIKKTDKLFKI